MGKSRWCLFPYNSVKEVPCCESRWCSLMWLGLSWPLTKRSCTTSCISVVSWWVTPTQRRMGACDANGQPISFHVEVLQKWTEGLLFIKMSHRRIWKWVSWNIGRWTNPVTIFDHFHTCNLPEILVVRYTLWHDDHLIRFSFQTSVYKHFFLWFIKWELGSQPVCSVEQNTP